MIVMFEQILLLLAFVMIGLILGRSGIADPKQGKVLSVVLVYVFLPCNVIQTFSQRFTPDYLGANWKLLVLTTTITVVIAVGAHFAVRLLTKDAYERSVYEYSLNVPNMGYLGIPLAQSFFGQTGLMTFMIMIIPLQVYLYTVGYAMLTKQKLNLKKLLNPVMISIALGMILGLCNVKLPTPVLSFLKSGADCMGPVSMVLAGIVISEFSFSEILLRPRIYPVVLLRLIVIPALVGLVLWQFIPAQINAIVVLMLALPCGMNTVIFPKLVEEDCKAGAGVALLSTVLCCATLPILLFLFGA